MCVCVRRVVCVYACLYIMDCTKSDTCAEEEYRERDSSCEVKLRLPTAAATYRMWLYFCHLWSGTHNVCILIPSTTLPNTRPLTVSWKRYCRPNDPAIVESTVRDMPFCTTKESLEAEQHRVSKCQTCSLPPYCLVIKSILRYVPKISWYLIYFRS